MDRDQKRRARREIVRMAGAGLDWVTFSTRASDTLRRVIPFDRCCWHLVDPGTVLFTGSLNREVACSGAWLAEHEYVVEDVNKWWYLARSGRRAGATSLATYGDLSRSARHRSQEALGIGDELRGSFVADGSYWGAVGFLRDAGRPWFSEEDVEFLASLSEPMAQAYRRALLVAWATTEEPSEDPPGVVVFDEHGGVESASPSAERWAEQMVEVPLPSTLADSKILQVIAARARAESTGQGPVGLPARARIQTRSGRWLLIQGTPLAGGPEGRTAVIMQPAAPREVAPLVALAYGLSERERQITQLCMKGQTTKEIAQTLGLSPYTVQDHLKSIFQKTGARSRGELVGQVFLEHYASRWEEVSDGPPGWLTMATPPATRTA